jgi:hypothetical protein
LKPPCAPSSTAITRPGIRSSGPDRACSPIGAPRRDASGVRPPASVRQIRPATSPKTSPEAHPLRGRRAEGLFGSVPVSVGPVRLGGSLTGGPCAPGTGCSVRAGSHAAGPSGAGGRVLSELPRTVAPGRAVRQLRLVRDNARHAFRDRELSSPYERVSRTVTRPSNTTSTRQIRVCEGQRPCSRSRVPISCRSPVRASSCVVSRPLG